MTLYRGAVTDPEPALTPERRPISTRWPLEIMIAETLRFLHGGPPPKSCAADGALAVRRLAEIAGCASTR